MKRFFKILGISCASLVVLVALLAGGAWYYIEGLNLDAAPKANQHAQASDLAFLKNTPPTNRGRVLAVVTSTPKIGTTQKKAGYELTELSRAYWLFVANGFEVDIASPLGGEPPVNMDDALQDVDYAFLNDSTAQQKIRNTLPLANVVAEKYQAIYFVGGKGTMFDFPNNPDIQRLVQSISAHGVIGAVCHGPAALIGVHIENKPILNNRHVTAFTNDEELFLIKEAKQIFPFLLQDELIKQGGKFSEGKMYLNHTIVDGNLVTGQNPWATWSVAEEMVRAMGYEPIQREPTPEEISVNLLNQFHHQGLDHALAQKSQHPGRDKNILLMHAVIAAMRWQFSQAYQIQQLALE